MKDETREALLSMVWQFAYRGNTRNNPTLYTGGLAALEDAFIALGWQNPKVIADFGGTCDVERCPHWATSHGIGWEETGYWGLCGEHYTQAKAKLPQPMMKQRAINREASRDENGYLPALKEESAKEEEDHGRMGN